MIEIFPSGPFATNAYILSCDETKKAVIIDPAPESAEPLLNFLREKKLELDKIILTHSHWDHFGDLAKVLEEKKVAVYVHKADHKNLIQPGSDGLPLFMPIRKVVPDHFLEDKDELSVGNLNLKVIHTPGHSPGGICLYLEREHVLFSGDTLFKGSIGNLSFPTSNPDQMWESLDKLSELPPQTKVYPGHGEPTSLEAETWLKNAKQIFN